MKKEQEKPLPHSPEAEKSVLGAVLLDNAYMPAVLGSLGIDDFFLTQNKKIFQAMLELTIEQKPIDIVLLAERLIETKNLDAAGGPGYLSALADGLPRVTNIDHYCKVVKDKATLRQIVYLGEGLMDRAWEAESGPRAILERSVKDSLALLSNSGASTVLRTFQQIKDSAMREIEESYENPEAVMALNFGIPRLDEMTSGLRRQDVVLLVGMTGHGKSTLAMQLSMNSDLVGHKGVVFSAEMSGEALYKRELAHAANIPLWHLRRPQRVRDKSHDLEALHDAADRLDICHLQIADREITPQKVWSIAEMLKSTSGIDFVVIDYDQLVIRAGVKRGEDQFGEQARFMQDAMNYAKKLDLCFVLLCQPRKVDQEVARGERPPRIEDIFGSSAAANAAHHIIWIMRTFLLKGLNDVGPEKRKEACAYVLKARNDRVGKVELEFDEDMVKFQEKPDWAQPSQGRDGNTRRRNS